MTIREGLREAAHRFELERISNPRLCAEVLLSHVLNVERTFLYAHDDKTIGEPESIVFQRAVDDRIAGIPLQYIVGRQEFYGREFIVNPSVLIPRPETEHVIEAVLESRPSPAARILDVGTGSGCIAITLALELPRAFVVATDISPAAVAVAAANAVRHSAPLNLVCMDLLDGISGEFDFIVSNPPYVSRRDMHHVQREVREHEPHLAVFSPADEMEIYRKLARDSRGLLRRGGRLIAEIGFGMEERVHSLFDDSWKVSPTRLDLQGIPRAIVMERLN